MLPSLSNCDLRSFPDSLPTTNLSVLRIVRFGYNNSNNFLPRWLYSRGSSDLSISGIEGPIDHISWRKLCNLQLLYLSNNDISGEIDDLVEALSGCGNASLEALQLAGIVSETHFLSLAKLERFHVS
ncbi:hypothetical protein OIU79_007032 [Salix purpurea]|uniref:Uncharacterized protein n=1 Tax=Salix purpurea TaxID=77065 RepID=A0A9Q0Z2V6_SALPP|nr:hypothetical protein OIU79_007032 [Salix purpurea]